MTLTIETERKGMGTVACSGKFPVMFNCLCQRLLAELVMGGWLKGGNVKGWQESAQTLGGARRCIKLPMINHFPSLSLKGLRFKRAWLSNAKQSHAKYHFVAVSFSPQIPKCRCLKRCVGQRGNYWAQQRLSGSCRKRWIGVLLLYSPGPKADSFIYNMWKLRTTHERCRF